MGDEQLPIGLFKPIVLFKKADEDDAKWNELCAKTIIIDDLSNEQSQTDWQQTSSITIDYKPTEQDLQQVKRLFKVHIPRKLKKRLKKQLLQWLIENGVKAKIFDTPIQEIIHLKIKIKQKYRYETYRKHQIK